MAAIGDAMSIIRRILIGITLAATLFVITQSAAAQTRITDVWTGTDPEAIAVNPATNRIYVINHFDKTVAVIDGANNTLLTTVPVGRDPVSIAANPLTNRIYVVNDDDDNVTVIKGESNTTYTIAVAHYPWAITMNTATNKIYVTGDTWNGKITRINGATNLTDSVAVRDSPEALAINPSTNKMYVANSGENTVSVIDEVAFTNIKTILVGHTPDIVVVNAMTNRIYVLNEADDTVSVIDGTTDTVAATIPVTSPRVMAINPVTNILYVGSDNGIVTLITGTQVTGTINTHKWSSGIVVNPVTNKIYITNAYDSTLTVIDGATNTLASVPVGAGPTVVTANLSINHVYTVNPRDNTITVVAGAGASALQFVSLAPCRLVDTRHSGGAIPGGSSRSFPVPQLGGCNVPSTAAAFSLNVTVVPREALGYLTIWPSGEDRPLVSTMNSFDGRFKANAAIIPAGFQGGVTVYASNTTDVVLDVNGYFTQPGLATYQFYPLTPCRVIDTRWQPNSDLGGPPLAANAQRDFPVSGSSCIPVGPTIKAYSFNFTAVPYPVGHQLGYLTVWPKGDPKPAVSTLNNPTATFVANAAIVPAGAGGGITVFVDQTTHLAVDIDGYFADPSSTGLSLYPTAPCRVLDTRKVGNGQPFTDKRIVDVAGSTCAPPTSAQAYAFNATVVPSPSLSYLTLWPDGQTRPVVSTLNAADGWVTSNMALVPTSNGLIDAYAAGITQLILDISAYFAP